MSARDTKDAGQSNRHIILYNGGRFYHPPSPIEKGDERHQQAPQRARRISGQVELIDGMFTGYAKCMRCVWQYTKEICQSERDKQGALL